MSDYGLEGLLDDLMMEALGAQRIIDLGAEAGGRSVEWWSGYKAGLDAAYGHAIRLEAPKRTWKDRGRELWGKVRRR